MVLGVCSGLASIRPQHEQCWACDQLQHGAEGLRGRVHFAGPGTPRRGPIGPVKGSDARTTPRRRP